MAARKKQSEHRRAEQDRDDVPSTVARSSDKAVETWKQTHDSAADQYGDGERAHRTAFSSLKHGYEKVGDHWEAKESKGPSDAQASRTGAAARDHPEPTAQGVDANASVAHLRQVARTLDVPGRSTMKKADLVDAIEKANNRATARARKG